MELSEKVKLIMAQIDILKLKANDHDWQCYVPDATKKRLESSLKEIDILLSDDIPKSTIPETVLGELRLLASYFEYRNEVILHKNDVRELIRIYHVKTF